MNISACMKLDVASIQASATLSEAVALFVKRHIGTLPVVDDADKLVGLLQMRDLVALVMPDFVRLMEDFDFVHDFGVLEARQPSLETLARPVSDVMRPPISVEENCGLLRAAAIQRHHRLLDIPVVNDDGQLVGIASRTDIGVALMATWGISTGEDTL